MEYEREDTLLVNRLNSGRLCAWDGVKDGSRVICVRYADYDKDKPQRWTTRKVGDDKGYPVMTIEISDGDTVFCIDADDAEINRGSKLRIREKDNSDRQKWYFRTDWITNEKLFNPVPYLNWGAGMSLRDSFDHHWDEVVLDRSFSATSQLFYLNSSHYHESIPE